MDFEKLKKHIKLCKKNLKSEKVKCCLDCPFEKEITAAFPEMIDIWERKRIGGVA